MSDGVLWVPKSPAPGPHRPFAYFVRPDPPRRPPVWAWVTAIALLFAALALLARAAL